MMNYNFMNYALMHTDGNEFRVLYFIANTLNMKKAKRCKVYNDVIADYLNMDARTVRRMTKKLEDKNLLKKDLVYEGGKSKVLYSLNYDILNDKDGTESASILDNFDTDNASILDRTVLLNNNTKEQKTIHNTYTSTNNIEEPIKEYKTEKVVFPF